MSITCLVQELETSQETSEFAESDGGGAAGKRKSLNSPNVRFGIPAILLPLYLGTTSTNSPGARAVNFALGSARINEGSLGRKPQKVPRATKHGLVAMKCPRVLVAIH
jgi:hypothetical protein